MEQSKAAHSSQRTKEFEKGFLRGWIDNCYVQLSEHSSVYAMGFADLSFSEERGSGVRMIRPTHISPLGG